MEERSALLKGLISEMMPNGIPTEEEIKEMSESEREILFKKQESLINNFSVKVKEEMNKMSDDIQYYGDVIASSVENEDTDLKGNEFCEPIQIPKKVKPISGFDSFTNNVRDAISGLISKINITPQKIIIFVVLLLSLLMYGGAFIETYDID